MPNVEIRVTQDHIDRGVACNSEGCPIAFAILDAGFAVAYVGTDGRCAVSCIVAGVDIDGDYFDAIGGTYRLTDGVTFEFAGIIPPEALSFLRSFDAGEEGRNRFGPFSFQLEIENDLFQPSWLGERQ